MSILIDTSVLLRTLQPEHHSHNAAVDSLAWLLTTGEPAHFTLQTIAEFWNVATRPAAVNGLGLSLSRVKRESENIERLLTLLPYSASIYDEWKRLVVRHGVRGNKMHDTKLVAAMNVHGVPKILTFNTADFKRYEVQTMHPAAV